MTGSYTTRVDAISTNRKLKIISECGQDLIAQEQATSAALRWMASFKLKRDGVHKP